MGRHNQPLDLEGKTKHAQTEDVLRAVALSLSNFLVYGPVHQLTEDSLEDCWEQLTHFWQVQGVLQIGGHQGRLVANEFEFPTNSRNMQTLEQSLESRKIPALEFSSGATKHEFRTILELLSMSPVAIDGHGGAEDFLKKRKVTHIRFSSARYRPVPHIDGAGGAMQAITPPPPKPPPPETSEYEAALLLAYLESDSENYIDKVGLAVEKLIQDPQLIAEMIFDAATAKSGSDSGGCDFEILSICVRRTVNLLINSPGSKSADGRILLINALNELKEELQYSVRAEDGQDNLPARILGEIIEETKERLSIDKLISDYALKRQLLLSMENRIMDVLHNHGFGLSATELERRLKQQGLTDDLWDELWSKSLKKRRKNEDKDKHGAVVRFEKFVSTPRPPGEITDPNFINEFITQITDVELEVNALVEQTRRRMDSLDKTFTKSLTASTGPTRNDILEMARLLVTIGHGLSEPSKMMSTSIELVRSGQVGSLTESQHAVLQMAALAGQKLQNLTYQLMAVAEANQT